MNILILTTKLPYPPKDGGAIVTLNMATGLADMGHHVTMLAMNTSKHYFPAGKIPRELQEKIIFFTVNVDTRIRWHAFVLNLIFSKKPFHSVRFRSKSFNLMLHDILSHNHFDIVQFEGPYLDYCVPIIRKESKAKLSFRAHNIENEIWDRRAGHTRNPFKRFYFSLLSARIKKLESSLLRNVDLVIPISEKDYKKLLKVNPDKLFMVCQAGIDIHAYPEPEPVSSFSLFFIGALDWGPNREGLDWFFKHVWEELISLYPGLKLHIAGRNPHYYLSGKSRHEGVVMEGEVDDARRFINSHPVMIVPLLSGSGIRIKILEAMLLARTVITTTIGAEGLDVTHEKNIFIANSPAEFIQYTGMLISDSNRLHVTGTAARQFVKENFDNLVIAKKMAGFYKEQIK